MLAEETEERRLQYQRTIFDTFPIPAFIVDANMRIHDFNTAAAQFIGPEPASALYRRSGQAFHCIYSEANGCGNAPSCKDCIIRNTVARAVAGKSTCRAFHRARMRPGKRTTEIDLLVTASLLPYTATPRALLILENLTVFGALYRRAVGPDLREKSKIKRQKPSSEL